MAVEAKPLLAEEAMRNLSLAGTAPGRPKNASLKNERGDFKPLRSVEKTVAAQFDVSQGYVYAAQKIRDKDEKVFQEVKAVE